MHHTEFIMLDYDHSIGGTFGKVFEQKCSIYVSIVRRAEDF